MRIVYGMIVAAIALAPNATRAAPTIIPASQYCAKPMSTGDNEATHYLVSGGWIMGWLSAANRQTPTDWLVNVRNQHVIDLISKYCRGDATLEQAAISVLSQLRMEAALRMAYKRDTGKDAPQE